MKAENADPLAEHETLLQIGEAADRVGLSLRTVRYYEEVGLFTPSARSPGGFRLYSTADVERLAILKGMKPIGFSLDQIRELMDLLDRADEDPADIKSGLERYANLAAERVERLERHLEAACKLSGEIGDRLATVRRHTDQH